MICRGRLTVTTMTIKAGRLLFALLFISVLFGSTGCGNRVEINDRSIVVGVAVDKPLAPEEKNQTRNEQGEENQDQSPQGDNAQGQGSDDFLRVEPPPKGQTPRYAMTIETPIIKALGGVGGGEGGGGGGGQPGAKKLVITSTGNTIWDIERHLSIRVGRQNFYGHLKAIIISDEVAQEGIHPVIDFFSRRREVQQNIKLAISNGEARKVLQVVPPKEDFASFYVDAILESLFRTGGKINTDMLDIRRSLADTGNAVLPRVRASSPNEVVAGGAAVIKDWKFIGWLSELETSGFNLVQGTVTGGGISVVDPKDSSGLLSLLFRGGNVSRKVEMANGKPEYKIEIFSEWDIVEKGASTMLWDTDYLHQVENRVAKETERRAIHVVDKMQREFKADIFGFGSMLAQKYPDYWKTVENQWDEKYFPEAKVHINSSIKIRRTECKT